MLQPSAAFLTTARPRAVATWLFVVAAMIVGIVIVGGITRLTNSGLSITEWKPITGIIPPLTLAQWQAEFANYKQIPAGYGWRLGALLTLGALQGVIGWWMVTSGLSVRTDVSHIRLAVHLMTALVTLAGIVWTALDLRALGRSQLAAPARLAPVAIVAFALLFIQLVYGAFTAGLDAGYAFSSWPLMGDSLYPAGVPMLAPGWTNAIDNPIMVQFIHRWLAFATAAGLVWLAVRTTRLGDRAGFWVVGLVTLQIMLGIATLMTGVDIYVAVAHQANAALLLIATVFAAHRVGSDARV